MKEQNQNLNAVQVFRNNENTCGGTYEVLQGKGNPFPALSFPSFSASAFFLPLHCSSASWIYSREGECYFGLPWWPKMQWRAHTVFASTHATRNSVPANTQTLLCLYEGNACPFPPWNIQYFSENWSLPLIFWNWSLSSWWTHCMDLFILMREPPPY